MTKIKRTAKKKKHKTSSFNIYIIFRHIANVHKLLELSCKLQHTLITLTHQFYL